MPVEYTFVYNDLCHYEGTMTRYYKGFTAKVGTDISKSFHCSSVGLYFQVIIFMTSSVI